MRRDKERNGGKLKQFMDGHEIKKKEMLGDKNIDKGEICKKTDR